MQIGNIDTKQKVMVIAEIGNNHEGDFELAKKMVVAAAKAGADAVKFQTFKTEHYVSQDNASRVAMLKRFELSFDQFVELKHVADEAGIIFLSTPFDLESARFLNSLVPAFKIASGDNSFTPLLECVAKFGKPILMSCGLAPIADLQKSIELIRNVWAQEHIQSEIAALHCVSAYPVPIEQANLSAINEIAQATKAAPGYSDHTLGINAAVLSVATGARIVEKHFTLDKNYSDFRDHQISADPAEMLELTNRIREAETIMGKNGKPLLECEKENLQPMRRSIAVNRCIKQGEELHLKDLTWIRPGTGIAPGNESEVIGRRASHKIQAFTILDDNDME